MQHAGKRKQKEMAAMTVTGYGVERTCTLRRHLHDGVRTSPRRETAED